MCLQMVILSVEYNGDVVESCEEMGWGKCYGKHNLLFCWRRQALAYTSEIEQHYTRVQLHETRTHAFEP